jgi:hypothetical protein
LFPLQEGNLVSWNILTNETSVIVSHDLLASVSEGKINTFEVKIVIIIMITLILVLTTIPCFTIIAI